MMRAKATRLLIINAVLSGMLYVLPGASEYMSFVVRNESSTIPLVLLVSSAIAIGLILPYMYALVLSLASGLAFTTAFVYWFVDTNNPIVYSFYAPGSAYLDFYVTVGLMWGLAVATFVIGRLLSPR